MNEVPKISPTETTPIATSEEQSGNGTTDNQAGQEVVTWDNITDGVTNNLDENSATETTNDVVSESVADSLINSTEIIAEHDESNDEIKDETDTTVNQSLEGFITDDSLTDSEKARQEAWEAEKANRFEQEATGADYGHFASEEFDRLLKAIDNPENHELEAQQQINAELAIIHSIMCTADDLSPTKPQDLFNNIHTACINAANTALENNRPHEAEGYTLQAAVVNAIEQRCHTYMTETYAAATNRAEEAKLDAALANNPDSLPKDAIS